MVSENIFTGKVQFSESIDRLMQAIILYKHDKIKKIVITSGSSILLNQRVKEADILLPFCISLGIPKNDIIIEPNSRNTHENALFTKELISTRFCFTINYFGISHAQGRGLL